MRVAGAVSWWRWRQRLRVVARTLTDELRQAGNADIRFGVHAKGTSGLELVVWPEAGVDTFFEPTKDGRDIDRAAQTFRRIAGLYEGGDRPPFDAEVGGLSDERLQLREALRRADEEYHRLCIDIQEPMVAGEQLRLDELAAAADGLRQAIAELRDAPRPHPGNG